MFALSKFGSLLIYPLGVAIFLLIAAILIVAFGKRKAGLLCMVLSSAVLIFFSMPPVSAYNCPVA